MKGIAGHERDEIDAARRAAPVVDLAHVPARARQAHGLDDQRRAQHGKDDGHHRHRARETAELAGRHRVNAYRQTPPGEQRQRAQHPRDGQRVAHASHGHRDTGDIECPTVRGQQPRDEPRIEHEERHEPRAHHGDRARLNPPLNRARHGLRPREAVGERHQTDVHDEVVRGVRGYGERRAAARGRARGSVSQCAPQAQREQRDRPRREQIEMPEQMREHERRAAEHHGGEHACASVVRDVHRECVRRRGVEKDRDQQVHVLCLDDREPGQDRRADRALECRVRVIDEVHAERREEKRRVEEARATCNHVPHPPQVPQEAVVVARQPRDVRGQVTRERPRPDDREPGHQDERSQMVAHAAPHWMDTASSVAAVQIA